MEKPASKDSNLSKTFWSLLFLVCIGLVIGHLVTVARAEISLDKGLIEKTFTSDR